MKHEEEFEDFLSHRPLEEGERAYVAKHPGYHGDRVSVGDTVHVHVTVEDTEIISAQTYPDKEDAVEDFERNAHPFVYSVCFEATIKENDDGELVYTDVTVNKIEDDNAAENLGIPEEYR